MRLPPRFYSIRLLLILWLLVPMTLLGLVATLVTSSLISSQANQVFDRLLLGVAQSIEQRLVHRKGEVILNMPYFTLDVMESASSEKVFYRVEQQSGNLLAGFKGLPLPDRGAQPARQNQNAVFYNTLFAGNELRAVALRIDGESPQTSVIIVVAESFYGRDAFADTILGVLLLVAVLTTILMLLTAVVAVQKGLSPLHRLSELIQQRPEHDLRPLVSQAPREVQPLVDSINGLVQRTRDNIEHIQQFNADVSHQLRTPLAEVKTLSELGQHELQQARTSSTSAVTAMSSASAMDTNALMQRQQQRLSQIEQITDFMAHTTQQLLSYAKTRQSLLDQQMLRPLELLAFCRAEVMQQAPRVYREGGEIEFISPDAAELWIDSDSLLLTGLLGNLIDNALLYGRGPEQGAKISVQLSLTPGPEANVRLSIRDQGPGIAPAYLASVTDRFVRLDRHTQGSGLGLAIVRQICEYHQATLTLENIASLNTLVTPNLSPPGQGLAVHITFPCRSSDKAES